MTGSVKAYNELTRPLLSEEDHEKFEWVIGAVLAGGPSNVVVVCGEARSGKSTLLTIVRKILTRFVGEFSPRVAFQSGELSEIAVDAFVFLETNEPVAPKGSLFIQTTGRHIPANKYYVLTAQTESELDAIAELCINRYHAMGEDHYRTQENNR